MIINLPKIPKIIDDLRKDLKSNLTENQVINNLSIIESIEDDIHEHGLIGLTQTIKRLKTEYLALVQRFI